MCIRDSHPTAIATTLAGLRAKVGNGRIIVAILFAGPAAVAGYAATHGIAKHLMPSDGWQMAFSIVGAAAVGVTALFRMAGAAPPDPGLERARDA